MFATSAWSLTYLIFVIDVYYRKLESLELLGIDKITGTSLGRVPEEIPNLTFLDLRQCNKVSVSPNPCCWVWTRSREPVSFGYRRKFPTLPQTVSGKGCLKLTKLLVNDLLKFKISLLQIH